MNMSAGQSIWARRSVSERRAVRAIFALTAVLATGNAAAATEAPVMEAAVVARFAAPDADQGVVVDARYFYAIDNHVIARHRRSDGAQEARWDGGGDGDIRHINSCARDGHLLLCANSNYPELPMGSSLEWFDPATMRHVRSLSLGLRDEGSLVWAQPLKSGWIAGFAHYDRADGRGGTGYKDSRYGNVVLFDREWRRIGGWLLPPSVQSRMQPHSASGGAMGPDGLLYLAGHDRGEIYAMGRPVAGPYLVHLATLAVASRGQAFAFVPGTARDVMVIDRKERSVTQMSLPAVTLTPRSRRF
jgi:hypothetical protein